jgi:plastocyanin
MKRGFVLLLAVILCALPAMAQKNTGTIKGHVRLTGALPGNPVIQMGVDPMCSNMNAGKRVAQEIVAADAHGNLANVFVRLQGSFPQTPVPSQPVTIDQRSCLYSPRVVGVRVGQTLQVRNDDPLIHNVHAISKGSNAFNASTQAGGAIFSFRPKQEEVMLRIACDIHIWMIAYVGVVTNPYFTVSRKDGTFEIDNVPAGTYTIQAWQERYGPLTKTVKVVAGQTAAIDFSYTGGEKPVGSGEP